MATDAADSRRIRLTLKQEVVGSKVLSLADEYNDTKEI